MSRALELAKNGLGHVSPNPMVGAVIVSAAGKIIGEGWHRKFGEAHAEVNACNSVEPCDQNLLTESTIYVTLEPCSHHGKTPPCSDLLIEKKFRRVVIGSVDPFKKVNGAGVARLRGAGIEVTTGVLEKECVELNRKFFTAHTLKRPFVTLKWAQSADGWMDSRTKHPFRFSSGLGQTLVHKLRSENDAILTSTKTVMADNPRLDVRHWGAGSSPVPVIIGKTDPDQSGVNIKENDKAIYYRSRETESILKDLYETHGLISVLVEGGPTLLGSFIESGLWDEARVEVSPVKLGADGVKKAPTGLPAPIKSFQLEKNYIYLYQNA